MFSRLLKNIVDFIFTLVDIHYLAKMWKKPAPERICSGQKDSAISNTEMILEFAKYLNRSRHFRRYGQLTCDINQILDVDEAVYEIFLVKGLNRENILLLENITRCMESMRMMSVLFTRLEALRCDVFDGNNDSHRGMLESFWNNMRGCPRNNPEVLISPEWLEVGFQSSDPTTDFRGMGSLGMIQLLYFSSRKQPAARMILQQLSEPSRYYPFAIIGINLTRLVMELLVQGRLHSTIFAHFSHLTVNNSLLYLQGPSNDEDCIRFCLDLVHDVYCVAFEELYLTWVVRQPASVMSFTTIYEEVKQTLLEKYQPLSS